MKYNLLIIWILLLGNACLAQIQLSGKVFITLDSSTMDVAPIYWSDDWQYSFRLGANIPKTRINLGLDYEKINDWEEFGISVLYSFFY